MYPLFISDDDTEETSIPALPRQFRRGVPKTVEYVRTLVAKGLRSVLLFGHVLGSSKNAAGSAADDHEGPVIRAIRALREAFPDLFIAADVCLCEYTDHGHCGLLRRDGSLDNLRSVERLAQVAVAYSTAGAHCVAPSDMNDNRVRAIKVALQKADMVHQTLTMSYSAKFHGCQYGPFRAMVGSCPSFGDRAQYQLPPAAATLARRAMKRDIEQGADVIMVKPAGTYLDIIRDASVLCPNAVVAAYQVSGEYAMIHAGAAAGVFPLESMAMETSQAIVRAGATIIISYFTPDMLEWLD